MKRRPFLAIGFTTLVAGCIADGEPPAADDGKNETDPSEDDDAADESETDESDPEESSSATAIADTEFLAFGDCLGERTDEAAVQHDADELEIEIAGCVTGRNGCMIAALGDVSLSEDGTLSVLVETFDDSEPGELCTEALEDRGYRLTVTFEGGLPESIEVDHDDVDGRRTVTTVMLEN